MKQNGELQGTDRLYFPNEVSFRPCDEGWLVVAVPTANWLVLPNDFQKTLLQHLIKGETIGEVFQLITTDEQLNDFKRLLAAITARSFALTTKAIACSTYISPMPAISVVRIVSCAQVNRSQTNYQQTNGCAYSQSLKPKAVRVSLFPVANP